MQILKKKEIFGFEGTSFSGSSPPGIFVSWKNYPKISIASLSPPQIVENASFLDEPQNWFGLSREKILSMRSQLIRGTVNVKANDAKNPSSEIAQMQELAMSSKPVIVSMELKMRPKMFAELSDYPAPLGPKAELKKLELSENPKIDKKVDYIVSDDGLRVVDALKELYFSNYSVGFISKLLSSGLLGKKKELKFVPTRWSISATDDAIGKELIENKVKNFAQLSKPQFFSSSYLGNSFFVLLAPAIWGFEQLEVYLKPLDSPQIISDHEFFAGRKDYASNVAGAYYAARLAVAEYLVKQKKQATAIIFREIGPEYKASLGVWVIRETVRNALKQKPIAFSELNLALKFLEQKLKIPFSHYKKNCVLLDFLLHQKRLF